MKNHEFIRSDAPKRFLEDDSLGRKNFIEKFAEALSLWSDSESSLIIELNGEPGSGKTSVKNMAIDCIQKPDSNHEKPLIVEFNPWHWYKHAQLTEAFFREIAVSLGKPNLDDQHKKLALKFKIYGQLISGGLSSLSSLANVLVPQYGGIIQRCVNKIKEIFNDCSELQRLKHELATKTLEEIKTELKADLNQLKAPLIVVIDDLDLLPSDEEMHNILQLVKGNADFPNMVYVLIFKKETVEERLTIESSSGKKVIDGYEYLKKIILMSFDLPNVEANKLKEELDARLQKIRQNAGFPIESCDEWERLYAGSLHIYFKTLRDINRYCASLDFYSRIFKNENGSEVNWIDFFALEILRVFEPAVYKRIYQEKALLTYSSSVDSEYSQKFYEEIKKRSKNPVAAVNILKKLFPLSDDKTHTLGNLSQQDIMSWSCKLRVCDPFNFERYFQFSIPDWDVSESEKQFILSLASNHKALLDKLNNLHAQKRLATALSRIQSDIAQQPKDHLSGLVLALLAFGEINQHAGFFKEDDFLLRETIETCFTQIQDAVERRKFIKEILSQTSDCLLIFGNLIKKEESYVGKFIVAEGKATKFEIDTDLNQLKSFYLDKLKSKLALSGATMISSPHFAQVFCYWLEWDESSAKKWLNNDLFQIPNGCISLLNAFSYGLDGPQILKTWLEPHNRVKLLIDTQKLQSQLTEGGRRVLAELKKSVTLA